MAGSSPAPSLSACCLAALPLLAFGLLFFTVRRPPSRVRVDAGVELGVGVSLDVGLVYCQVLAQAWSILRDDAYPSQTLDLKAAFLNCPGDNRVELGYAARELPILEIAVCRFGRGFLQTEDFQQTGVVVDSGEEPFGVLFGQQDYHPNTRVAFMAGNLIPAQVYYKAQKLRAVVRQQVLETRTETPILPKPSFS